MLFRAPGQVDLHDADLGPPPAKHVLVRAICSAISSGTELLFYRGLAPADLAVDESIGVLGGAVGYPLKYGYAVVGEVVETGPEVDRDWRGRLVFAFNPHESHFVAAVADLLALPAEVAPEDAVFLANVETAVNLVMDGRPIVGERVVVLGQGVVGLLTTALLARSPLAALVTLDRYALRRSWSLELGAHESYDPVDSDVHDRLRAALEDDGSPGGADLIYELSGVPEALNLAIASAGFGSRVVVGSWYGEKQAPLRLGGRFHRDRVHLMSSQVSTIAPELTGRWTKARRLRVAWQVVRTIQPARLITHRFPIEAAADAYALLDRRPEDALQVVFHYA